MNFTADKLDAELLAMWQIYLFAAGTTRYVNDLLAPNALVLAETDTNNVPTRLNIWGPVGLVSTGGAGATGRFYPLTDSQGSVRFLTDSSGNVVRSYTYTPYGTATTTTSSASTTPYQYTSENLDSETGLNYLRARYYDPTTGRFISRDPVRGTLDNPITQNPYIYAADNPTTYTDPSGEIVWDVIDVGFFFLSLDEFNDCPGLWSGLQLGADTLSLLPGIPSLGWILRADDAAKIAKNAIKWPSQFAGSQVINGITYTGHALERMEPVGFGGRGIPPSVVENAIKYGEKTVGKSGEIIHTYENVTVATNQTSDVVFTVYKTGH